MCDDGRLEKIWAEIGATIAAGENLRAALFGVAKLLFDFFKLALANHRANVGFGIRRRAQAQLLGFFNAELQ